MTGYPQLGVGNIHIAHELWGGLFMLLSMLGLMAYLNDGTKPYFAILGGIGFGTFIDELGKFVTSDNNYFYQPTFAIIYIIFIYLYLIFKTVQGKQKFSKDEYLINSLDKLKEVIINDLDKQEQEEALAYLSKSNQKDPITMFLKKTFIEIKNLSSENEGVYTRIRTRLSALYFYLVKKDWFIKLIVFLFVLRAIFYFLEGVVDASYIVHAFVSGKLQAFTSPRNIFNSIEVVAFAVQAILIVVGALIIRRDRRLAYVYFRNAVLLSILVIQIFNFYESPLIAFFLTIGDLILFAVLSYMISREEKA